MKKKILIAILAFVLVLPLAFILTACGDDNNDKNEMNNVYIKVDDYDYSTSGYIYEEYNDHLFISSFYNRISFAFGYKDGTMKEATEDNFSEEELKNFEYTEKYYKRTTNETTGESLDFEEFEINPSQSLNAGDYKIVFTIEGYQVELQISIGKANAFNRSLNIAIIEESSTIYPTYSSLNRYKFGMQKYSNTYDVETYRSGYKAYVYDNYAREVVSGTKVKNVYAMPRVAPQDYTFTWSDTVGGSFTILAGDNLIEKYNEITVADTYIKNMRQNEFLDHYAIEFTTGKVLADNTIVVNTECLMPGAYYIFARVQDENHYSSYSVPSTGSTLDVQKGDFNWKYTIYREGNDYSEEEVTNFINSLQLTLNYTFNPSEPLFSTANNKALSIDRLKSMTIQIDSSYGGDWYNEIKSCPIVGGRNAFGWVTLELTGKDENGHPITALDARDSGIRLQAKIRMDENLKAYYGKEDETIYLVQVTINKGSVSKPSYDSGYLSYAYTGNPITLAVTLDTANVYNITGNNITQTSIGQYHTTYALKDSINYYVWGDENYTGETINWEIKKIVLDEGGFTKTFTYNNVEQNYGEFTYADGEKSIKIALSDYADYNLIKSLDPNVQIVWRIEDEGEFVGLTLRQTGDDLADGECIVTFTGCTSDYAYFNLKYSIAGTDYSQAYDAYNSVQVIFHKREYTQEELNEIYGEFFEKQTDVWDYEYYVAKNNISISRVTLLIPAEADPATDATITTTLGVWKLYRWDFSSNSYVELTPGTSTLKGIDFVRLLYSFVPNDDMYITLEALVEDEYYNEDMPQDILTALATEVPYDSNFVATGAYSKIYLDEYSNYLSVPQYALPTHNKDAEGFDGFEGRWVLLWDYEDENGNACEMTAGNNSCLYYQVDEAIQYSNRSKDYLLSSDRNWRIAFIPEESAYNRLELQTEIRVLK